jgi:hypothetical protein
VTGRRYRLGVSASAAVVVAACSLSLPAAGLASKPHTAKAPAQRTSRASKPRRTFYPASMTSAPKGAKAGSSFKVSTKLVNKNSKGRSAKFVVRLTRGGSAPITVGTRAVSVAAGGQGTASVSVTLPKGLDKGDYALVGCVPVAGEAGYLECATAASHVEIGTAAPATSTKVRRSADETCTSGAHTLSKPGDRVYPEMGNGGYNSLHTDAHFVYDVAATKFLDGTNVDLTQQATQCLKDFSVDFETANGTANGPNLAVSSITVNGQPATYTFVQPTYPGDPNGQDDPDPNAHLAGQVNPISATINVPPACAPVSTSASAIGKPCPASKLVITPPASIPTGATFHVVINYAGKPGTHIDGDGSEEGWFLSSDGSFVTTEPVGNVSWMPLNNHPSQKPTYDITDTVTLGKTAVANGELVSQVDDPTDTRIAGGTTTWHWHSPEGIANYLVTNSIGNYDLTNRISSTGPNAGVVYYEAQSGSITAAKKATNKVIMDTQQDITDFQTQFNGKFPFSTDGVVIGVPNASFEEEMQTKITFAGGSISSGTFNHENMHQWWGDNVSEGSFNMTFFKEGMATVGEYLNTAKGTANNAPGSAAFEASLVSRFNSNYASNSTSTWGAAPSNPTNSQLFSTGQTYTRPGTAYLALRQILGAANFNKVLQDIQTTYAQKSITEPQLEAVYHKYMPNQSTACSVKLDQFFTQWFDTAFASGSKPTITGPGLAGPGFYDASGGCSSGTVPATTATIAPAAGNGFFGPTSAITLTATDAGGPGVGTTMYSLDGGAFTAYTTPIPVGAEGSHSLAYYTLDTSGNQEPNGGLTYKVDATAPVTTATVSPTPVAGQIQTGPAVVTLASSDALSGVAAVTYAVDGGDPHAYGGPITVTGSGGHSVSFQAVDAAGNHEDIKAVSFVIDATGSATVGGTVNSTLALAVGSSSASLGTFVPGVAADYATTLPVTVTSTGGDAALTIGDPSSTATGHLVNGTFSLAQPLQAAATRTGGGAPSFGAVTGIASPLAILAYSAPVSNDPVTLWLKQSIGANDALRTGKYTKTVVLTLSTQTP